MACASASAAALDAEGERFKASLVAAYSNPSAGRIQALLHPKSLACMRAEPKYESYLLRAESMQAVPVDAKLEVNEIPPGAALPFRGFEFPLRPSHVVRMEYGRKASPDGRSATTQIVEKHIAREGGRWYLILPCATPEGMGRLREMGLLK